MSKKEITINDLAIMVKHGFDGVDKRFDGVDKRIDTLEGRINVRFDNVEARLDRIEKGSIVRHEQRIEKLEDDVVDIKGLLAIK